MHMMAATSQNPAYKHVIPLDFHSVKSMPESHVWPESDDVVYSGTDQPPVPLIDLRDPNAPELVIKACETWGVFLLTGHGVPARLMKDVETETHRLFDLPAEQKLKTLRIPGGPSSGYGNPPSQASLPRKLWQEGFTVMGSPLEQAKILWPHDHQRFCETMDNYQKQVKGVVEKLLRIIFKYLSISEEEVKWFDDCNVALQLNSYPPCPDPAHALGLAPHTDSSLLTLLHSETEGLQIFKHGFGWILLQPMPDALIVNIGDCLHVLSNGRFVSVFHRAAVNQKYHRISEAYFFWPPTSFSISPLVSKTFADSGEVPKYRPVTLKEYLGLKSKHFQQALSFIKA